MDTPNRFRYNYTFLYQSMAVYATTLALYLVIRAMMHGQFSDVFYDPVVYLLCVIIIISALGVLYNAFMHRAIEVSGSALVLRSAFRETKIDISNVRFVRSKEEHSRGFISRARVVSIHLKDRRRPVRIRPFNFERSDDLLHSIKQWAGSSFQTGQKGQRRRSPRNRA